MKWENEWREVRDKKGSCTKRLLEQMETEEGDISDRMSEDK